MKFDIWSKKASGYLFVAQMALAASFLSAPAVGIIYLNSLPDAARHAMAVMIESHQEWGVVTMSAMVSLMMVLHILDLEGGRRRRQRAREAYVVARAKGLSWAPYGWGRDDI
jgi:hypothetical protein